MAVLLLLAATLQVPVASARGQTASAPTGVVRGQVRSEGTGAPLRMAAVEVIGVRGLAVARTDSSGTYVLRNLPPGLHLLRATHIDHATHEVEVYVGESREVVLNFDLEMRPVRLPTITTRAAPWRTPSDTIAAGVAGLGQASVRVLESTPGVAELGLAEIAREVPGHEPLDPSDILYVRGGSSDLKLVLLDGAPVYAPFHLGGLINALDPDLMRSARLYLGGAPARYDGGLSYVMDLETRSGRSTEHASLGMDLLASHARLEGPIVDRVTYLAGGRAVHGLGARPFTGEGFPYLYGDAIGRLDIDLGRNGRITSTGFWNRESVVLDSLGGHTSEAVWGNAAGSVRYRGAVGGSNAEITVGVGAFSTELPVGGPRPLMTDGYSRRLRVGINLDRPAGPTHVQYGFSFDRLRFEYRAWPRPRTVREDSLLLRANGAGTVAGTYVDATWQALPTLQLRGGLRTDIFSTDPTPRFAPRVSATLLLGERASVTLAAGSYRQYVRAPENSLAASGARIIPDSSAPDLAIARASHVVLTLDQDLGEGIRLGIEGYYKDFKDVPSDRGDEAQASGVDLWLRRSGDRLSGWIGYSLGWTWSDEQRAGTGAFAGRHLISAGLVGPLGNQGGFDLRIAYGAGLPYTAIPEPETPVFAASTRLLADASDPLSETPLSKPPNKPYIRIDFQVERTFIADVRGFAFQITPYFKVLNALDRRDALFYHFDRSEEDPETRPLAPLPLLPILGLQWTF